MTWLEFKVLAASEGLTTFYGLNPLEQQTVLKEDVIQAMYELTKKGWGYVVNQGFQLNDEMRLIFQQIISAQRLLSVQLKNGRRFIGYLGSDMVTMTCERNGMMCIQGMEYEKLADWLEEEILFTVPFWQDEIEAQEALNDNEVSLSEISKLQKAEYEDFPLIAEIEVRGEKGESLLKKDIFVKGITNIWIIGENSNCFYPDSVRRRETLISEWREMRG